MKNAEIKALINGINSSDSEEDDKDDKEMADKQDKPKPKEIPSMDDVADSGSTDSADEAQEEAEEESEQVADEGVVVPEDAPIKDTKPKKNFVRRVFDAVGLGADDEDEEAEEEITRPRGRPDYRDPTDIDNI